MRAEHRFCIDGLTQSDWIESNIALDDSRHWARFFDMSDEVKPAIQMLVLERIDGSKNISPYYVLAVTPTLFGESALVREWGRIGTSVRRRIDLHADGVGAAEALHAWLRGKTKRGYVVSHQTSQCLTPKLADS